MECPRTEMFQLLFGGKLTPEQQGPLADHAATCPACHAVVETMLGGPQTQQGGPQTDSRPMTVGSIVGGRFRIDRLLGAGGMGIVVAATHLELGNRIAIKFMRDDKLEAVAVERFIREARAVVKLRTEHVCRVFDVARLDNGAPYIVMELLDGVDLGRTVAARPLPATIAVEYVMQAAVGLAEAHALGIVHRDLKPANLFVTRRHDGGPLVKVLDFGIAKALDEIESRLTRTRVLLGSPGYISPEQLDSPRDVDARTDIWALGVTLYQLLSGRLPFWGRNQTEIAVKIAAEPPPPLEGDPRLVAVVLRCLEKACSDRYSDVVALAADLVPFGGPRARRIAAAIARAAKPTGSQPLPTPGALPAVSLQAPTAATGATPGTTATGGQPALVGNPPMPMPGRPMSAAMPGYVAGTPGSGTPAAGAVSTAGTGPVNAANSLAMTLAVSRPVDMSRYIAASALAAGSGAARAQRARRWQLAAVGVVGVIVAAAVALAVRSPSQPPGSGSGASPAGSTAGGTGKPGSESAAPGAPSSSVQSAAGSSPGAAHAADASASQSAAGSSPGAAHAADASVSRTGASSHPAGASASAAHAGSPAAASPPGQRHAGAPSAHPGSSPTSRHGGAATAHAAALPTLHPSPPAAAAAPAASGSASSGSSAPSVTAPASSSSGSAANDAKPERAASAQRGSASPPPPPLDPERKRACAAMLEPGGAVQVSMIAACWCQSHDQLHAQAALSRLPKSGERDAAKRDCHKLGVELQ